MWLAASGIASGDGHSFNGWKKKLNRKKTQSLQTRHKVKGQYGLEAWPVEKKDALSLVDWDIETLTDLFAADEQQKNKFRRNPTPDASLLLKKHQASVK